MPRAAKFSIGGEWGQFSYIDVHAHAGAREMTSIEANHPHCPPSPDARASDMTAAAGFGLAWPPAGYANCASYSSMTATPPQEPPYSRTKARGGTAHAEPWDDAAMARFQARAAAIQRRGFGQQDAEDLAEQLHLRDVQAAHRIYCLECRHLDGSVSTGLRCGNHRFASVGRDLPVALVTMAQVCSGFSAMPARVPMADDATQPSTR